MSITVFEFSQKQRDAFSSTIYELLKMGTTFADPTRPFTAPRHQYPLPHNSPPPANMQTFERGDSMECKVKWTGDGMSFLAETGSKHTVVMDTAPEAGGRNLAPRPMEMLLAGTGGCTAFDIVSILKKGRHAVTGCEVSLKAERAETEPKIFTRIHFHFRVSGKELKPEIVARAIKLSKDKYCSASIILGKTAKMTHDFEIIEG